MSWEQPTITPELEQPEKTKISQPQETKKMSLFSPCWIYDIGVDACCNGIQGAKSKSLSGVSSFLESNCIKDKLSLLAPFSEC